MYSIAQSFVHKVHEDFNKRVLMFLSQVKNLLIEIFVGKFFSSGDILVKL